jgi:hypothetical protein
MILAFIFSPPYFVSKNISLLKTPSIAYKSNPPKIDECSALLQGRDQVLKIHLDIFFVSSAILTLISVGLKTEVL